MRAARPIGARPPPPLARPVPPRRLPPPGPSADAGSSAARGSSAAAGSSADHLRLFVALELPAAAREALVAFRDAAADPAVWRPRRPRTRSTSRLRSWGAGRPRTSPPSPRSCARAAGPAPRLALGGALLLPPRRAARAVRARWPTRTARSATCRRA